MKTTSITQAKNQLSALLEAVRHGETVLIMDRNCPVARLEPVTGMTGTVAEGRLARLERAGLLLRGSGELPEWVREGRSSSERQVSVLRALLAERDEGR